jgi:hypothetical protein
VAFAEVTGRFKLTADDLTQINGNPGRPLQKSPEHCEFTRSPAGHCKQIASRSEAALV